MEASLLTVAPVPKPPQESAPQANQTTEEDSSFTTILSAARSVHEQSSKETGNQDSESPASPPSQQEILLAAELVALSLQDNPALNTSQLVSGQDITTTFSSISNSESAMSLSLGEFKQFQAMPAAKGQTATEFFSVSSNAQLTGSVSKTESLLSQQLQTILTENSRDTITLHAPYQSAPAETLDTLSSPYLQSADSTSAFTLAASHGTIVEKAVNGTVATNTLEGVHQDVGEQYLSAKIEALSDKNNTKNHQQENSPNQQNTTALTTTLNNPEQSGQFILTTPGNQPTALSPVNSPLSSSAAYSPGTPIPAEEIISHLVERFSTNPRLQTSKISLNLNPAELGALKVDILVKGDSIRAHIIVNNQQIQETIEKHMPKLRTILEQQGFTIDDFQVTLESTNHDSDNFFQQQFSSGQDSAQQKTLASDETSFDLSLTSAEEILGNTSMDSGINLNI
ncbi:MAG: flagellar hook-length control protein FliK [Pseudomonadota bacterium]